jgi:CubicO group peptidase (beta-lactamase class C family)/fucose 4-O-acetylase-like acetyltransferase
MVTTLEMTPARTQPEPISERSSFLDALRAFALARVVLWHTFGTVALSYVAAMPLMFFVAGSLAGPSTDRHDTIEFYRRRLRRLLVPLWPYAAVAWLVFLVGGLSGMVPGLGLGRESLLWWLVPIGDPLGPEWAVAWWAPLWYLRAYLWLMLLTPILRRIVQRAPGASLAVAAVTVAASGLVSEQGGAIGTPVRDLILFGFFWMAGLVYAEGRLVAERSRPLVAAAVVVGAVGAAWMIARPVPLGIVNASYTAHFLLGTAWILLAMAFQGPIARFAERPRVAVWCTVMNRRAVTIYLWHCAAAYSAYLLAQELGVAGVWRPMFLIATVVSMTALAVTLFGWVEDVAAARTPRRWPTTDRRARRALVALASLAVVLVATLGLSRPEAAGGPDSALAQFIPGSGYGIELLAAAERSPEEPPFGEPISDLPVAPEELEAELAAWAGQWGVTGAIVAVRDPDAHGWLGGVGVDEDGSAIDPRRIVSLFSITKSYTAALILTLAAQDDLELDAPVSRWAPELPHADQVTVRELLYHRSGLGASGLGPQEALEQARREPLAFESGTESLYSDVGYFELGVIAERAGGDRFTALVREQLIEPLELRHTYMDEELEPSAWPRRPGDHDYYGDRWSAGGMRSTVDDAARWAVGFWGGALGDDIAGRATELDDPTHLGAGTNGFCPCWFDDEGASRALTYGHLSPHGRTSWGPREGVGIAIYTVELLDGVTYEAWADLDTRLRRIVFGRDLPVPAA